MKKNIFWIIPALTLLFISCNKELPKNETVSEKVSGLEVKATLPSITKSTLGADGLTLNWAEGDKLAMWSTYLGTYRNIEKKASQYARDHGFDPGTAMIASMLETIHDNDYTKINGTLSLSSGAGSSSGTFTSDKPAEQWFYGVSANADYNFYWFSSIYPAPDVIPEWRYFDQVIPEANNFVVHQPYVMVNIPTVQDGKSYWKYQLLLDRGINERDNYPEESNGFVIKDEVIGGDFTLNFSDWNIQTSLLEFTVRSSDVAERSVDHIDITFEFGELGANDRFALSGTVPLFLLLDEDYENSLCSSFKVPFGPGEGGYVSKGDSRAWSEMDEGVCKVTLKFDEPLVVNENDSETLYAVLIPTLCSANLIDFDDKPKMVFSAYDNKGDLILFKRMEMQNTFSYYLESHDEWHTCYPGLRKGFKYTFDVEFDPIIPPEEALSGQFSIAEGTRAYIARGNLWAYINNGVLDTSVGRDGWKIAQHQYDIVGKTDYSDFNTYEGWIDLFGFSTNQNDHGIPVISGGDDVANYGGDEAGWSDCMAINGWRTITADEGVYLFGSRPNALDLIAFATIYVGSGNDPVNGLLFLPDNWTTPPSGCSFISYEDSGYTWKWDGTNSYNAAGATAGAYGSWEDMEDAGAVFWPVAGRREGTSVTPYGSYWSGTQSHYADMGCLLVFATEMFSPSDYPRSYGACVRLVRDVTETE